MITGVTKGYLYKMRLAYAHFPITTNIVDGNTTLEIRNFLREAEVRRVHAIEGVKIEASTAQKDELIISGNDVESVSCTCAKIHDSVKIRNKDLRKFLDGIFVSYKGHISEWINYCSRYFWWIFVSQQSNNLLATLVELTRGRATRWSGNSL